MKLKKILLIAILLIHSSCTTTSTQNHTSRRLEVSCIGPESADTFVIYLHGMDSIIPSQQEKENRAILQRIAKVRNIRFALPRAQMTCPTQPGSVCWGWNFDPEELSFILPKIMDSRSQCFSTDKPFKILGFSNGGYLLTRWYSNGLKPPMTTRPTTIVTAGSGKALFSEAVDSLSSNPDFILIIGKRDQYNFDQSHKLLNRLKVLKASVQLIEFDGGHALDEQALQKVFSNLR